MSKPSAILTHDNDHAYRVVQVVLGCLASIIIAGLIWTIWHSTEISASKVTSHSPLPSAIPLVFNPPSKIEVIPPSKVAPILPVSDNKMILEPLQPLPLVPLAPVAALGSPQSPANLGAIPALSVSDATTFPIEASSTVKALKNPQILEAIEAGKLARKQGDMQASLEALRGADAKEPNHPLILSEIALTYEEMGILTKASAAWRSIVTMGEQSAGSYFNLAKSKLDGRSESMLKNISAIKLGECQVIRDASAKKGERIAVRVPLLATPGAVIDPAQMDIHVYLYESVNNGERIEQARAKEPSLDWVSAPVDWKESNEELVDVVYDLPSPKPEELREFGQRKFHGYVVKLFYQNKLVGDEAQPASLRDFSPMRNSSTGLDGALFPKQ